MLKDAIEFSLTECLAQAEKASNDALTPRENSVIVAKKENPERLTRSLDAQAVVQPYTGDICVPSIPQSCNTSSDKNVVCESGMSSSPSFIQLNKRALQILESDPELFGFMLRIATLIRYSDEGVNLYGENVGEAFIKGCKQFGLTRKQYRVLQQRAITNQLMKFRRHRRGMLASFTSSEFMMQGPSTGSKKGHLKGHQNEHISAGKSTNNEKQAPKKGPSKGPRKGHHMDHPHIKDSYNLEGIQKRGATSAPLSFGRFVRISQNEYDELNKKHGEKFILDKIEEVNDYCLASKPSGYLNYAAAIRNFIRRNPNPQGNSQEKGKDSAENIRLAKCWEDATLDDGVYGMAAKPDCVLFRKPKGGVEISYNMPTQQFKDQCKPHLNLLTQKKK